MKTRARPISEMSIESWRIFLRIWYVCQSYQLSVFIFNSFLLIILGFFHGDYFWQLSAPLVIIYFGRNSTVIEAVIEEEFFAVKPTMARFFFIIATFYVCTLAALLSKEVSFSYCGCANLRVLFLSFAGA